MNKGFLIPLMWSGVVTADSFGVQGVRRSNAWAPAVRPLPTMPQGPSCMNQPLQDMLVRSGPLPAPSRPAYFPPLSAAQAPTPRQLEDDAIALHPRYWKLGETKLLQGWSGSKIQNHRLPDGSFVYCEGGCTQWLPGRKWVTATAQGQTEWYRTNDGRFLRRINGNNWQHLTPAGWADELVAAEPAPSPSVAPAETAEDEARKAAAAERYKAEWDAFKKKQADDAAAAEAQKQKKAEAAEAAAHEQEEAEAQKASEAEKAESEAQKKSEAEAAAAKASAPKPAPAPAPAPEPTPSPASQ